MSYTQFILDNLTRNPVVPQLQLRPEFSGAQPVAAPPSAGGMAYGGPIPESPPLNEDEYKRASGSGFEEAKRMLEEIREAVADKDAKKAQALIASSPIPLQSRLEPSSTGRVSVSESVSVSGPLASAGRTVAEAPTSGSGPAASKPQDFDEMDLVLTDDQGREIYRGSPRAEREKRRRAFGEIVRSEGQRLQGLDRRAWDSAATVIESLGLPVHQAQAAQNKLFESLRDQLQSGENSERMAMSRAASASMGAQDKSVDWYTAGENSAKRILEQSGAKKRADAMIGLNAMLDELENNAETRGNRLYVDMSRGGLWTSFDKSALRKDEFERAKGSPSVFSQVEEAIRRGVGLELEPEQFQSLINTLRIVNEQRKTELQDTYDSIVSGYEEGEVVDNPEFRRGRQYMFGTIFKPHNIWRREDWQSFDRRGEGSRDGGGSEYAPAPKNGGRDPKADRKRADELLQKLTK